MIRLFKTHRIRQGEELDGLWDLHMDGVEKSYRLPVPSCWEQHPDFLRYRGVGTYTRKITLAQMENLHLEFKGVSHTADVFLDGHQITHHYNAYTPFSAVIQNVSAGEHILRVVVDNRFTADSALHIPNDYYTYGGIIRPVCLEYLPDVYIRKVHFTPVWINGIWHGEIEISLCNLSQKDYRASLCITLNGQSIHADAYLEASKERIVHLSHAFPSVREWSPEHPNLYMLNSVVYIEGKEIDDFIERVGFRRIEIQGTRLLLNGNPIFLKGFNRHEDYASDGCAVSFQHMVQDMDLMQDMHANAVRTCHYPNDERFLDLCDERGILVWEESHARGLTLPDMQNPNFERQCADCIHEMVENHYNHPAIIIWGILNECASETEEGRRMYEKQYAQLQSLDASRPATSATCRHFKDICLDLPDIVSYNLYAGWYEDSPAAERNRREIDWIRESGGANKPIIASEFGAGANYGFRDRSHCKWTEEYQADVLRDHLNYYLNDPNVSGAFIWQFADCRVSEEVWFAKRARCHNNKGVVDEYRRPKLAYDVVKEMFAVKTGNT